MILMRMGIDHYIHMLGLVVIVKVINYAFACLNKPSINDTDILAPRTMPVCKIIAPTQAYCITTFIGFSYRQKINFKTKSRIFIVE